MTHAKELFGEEDNWYNYDILVNSFGHIEIDISSSLYQGDTWILYHETNGIVGYLLFGWGSCSGCDALQACRNIDDVEDLRQSLEQSIIWFDNPEKALEWFKTHDWEGDWGSSYDKQSEFVKKSITYLEKLV